MLSNTLSSATKQVVRCSGTLESIDVWSYLQGTLVLALWCSYNLPSFVAGPAFVDLSKATKLRFHRT